MVGACAFAATPETPLAEKGALIFSDEFTRSDLGPAWQPGIPAFTVTGTALKGNEGEDEPDTAAAFRRGLLAGATICVST